MSQSKAKMVKRLISKIGSKTNVQIVRVVGGTKNQLNGSISGGTIETISTSSFVSSVPDSLIDGTRIKASDRQVLFDNEVSVLQSDTIKISGIEFKVEMIDEYNHAGEIQFTRVICRG